MAVIDPLEFRRALGCYATGVAVITACAAGGAPIGVTVNSFTSVSLEPPLVSFCLDRQAWSFPLLAEAAGFAVNVLAEGQEDLSARFARATDDDRFAGIGFTPGEAGCPLLDGCLTWIECRRAAAHEAGDHIILLGRVEALRHGREEGRPLLYFRGRYGRVAHG